MPRRSLSSLTASVAAAALSFGLLAATPGLALAGTLDDKTTFLGLEGDGDQVASLSDAIRWDLNQRGLDDGNTMSLAELKLTMGCGDDDLGCYAQGGKTLGSSVLVFGEVNKDGNNYVIRLRALNVETGQLQNEVQRTVPFIELGEAQLGATAASLVDELYEIKSGPEDIPPGGEDVGEGGEGSGEGEVEGPSDEPRSGKGDGNLVWGPYSPRPAWKYVGVGVSGALMVAGLGMGIGASVAISENGPIRKDLLEEARLSLTDSKSSNDVDPNSSGDLCEIARTPPDAGKPNEVTNARVTQVCIRAENVATLATVGWVTTGIFAVSTIAFTTLLFVHKKDAKVAKLREHGVGFGGAPTLDGGFVLGGSFSF